MISQQILNYALLCTMLFSTNIKADTLLQCERLLKNQSTRSIMASDVAEVVPVKYDTYSYIEVFSPQIEGNKYHLFKTEGVYLGSVTQSSENTHFYYETELTDKMKDYQAIGLSRMPSKHVTILDKCTNLVGVDSSFDKYEEEILLADSMSVETVKKLIEEKHSVKVYTNNETINITGYVEADGKIYFETLYETSDFDKALTTCLKEGDSFIHEIKGMSNNIILSYCYSV